MIHFTCDCCGKPIGEHDRYVAKIEIAPAATNPTITAADLDGDHLSQIAELINRDEADEPVIADTDLVHRLQFDLCESCRNRFRKDPLSREQFRRVRFSNN